MKRKIIFTFILFWYNLTWAQTIIPSGTISGTWAKSGSPYKVQGDITIPKGSSLTIDPGVVVEFQGRYTVFVDGIVNAIGKKGDSITFKAAPTQTWCGFVFYKNTEDDTIEFNYTRWENVSEKWLSYKGKYPFEWRKLVVLVSRNIFCAYSSPLKVKNSSFYFNVPKKKQANLIYTFKTPLFVDSIYITSSSDTISQGGGMVEADSINYFSVKNIEADKIKYNNNLLLFRDCISSNQKPLIIENISLKNSSKTNLLSMSKCSFGKFSTFFGENLGLGITMGDCRDILIKNAQIINSLNAFGSSNSCVGSIIENCIFERCGKATQQWGMTIYSNGPLFKNCKFINNFSGIFISQINGPGTPIFLNCEFNASKARAASIEGYPLFINCNFTDNSDVHNTYTGSTNIPYMGGVVVLREFDNSRPYFYNCLFWGNKDSFGNNNSIVLTDKVVKADLTNCIVQGDSSSGIVGYDYMNPPKFYIPSANLVYKNSSGIAPGFIDSGSGNFRLNNTCSQTAYAINKGMSGNLLTQYPFNILKIQYGVDIYNTTDLDGNLRVMDDTIDIGCYESSGNKKELKLKSGYSDTTLCYGASNMYSASTFGYVESYTWQKRIGSNINSVSTNATLNLSNIQTPGQEYRLLVTNDECLPLKDSSRWFTVNVNKPLKKGIVKFPNTDTIALKDTMQLSTSTAGYRSFLWSNNATSSIIKFTGNSLGPKGKYMFTLEARNINGCLETDTTYIITKDNPQGIGKETYNQFPILIYPQPAGDILNISILNNKSNTFRISILDLVGNSLFENTEFNTNHSIDISALKSGIYILTLINTETGESTVLKWLKT